MLRSQGQPPSKDHPPTMDSQYPAQQANLGMLPLPRTTHNASPTMPPFPAPAASMATLPQRRMPMAPAYSSMSTSPASPPSLSARSVSHCFAAYAFVLVSDDACLVYHIHDQPVPADGNCTATAAHLDPYIRGEIPPCDNTQPETCQVGDLTGKHGNVTVSPFAAQ